VVIEELGLLASDPAHGYIIEPQGLKERDVGLAFGPVSRFSTN
jgi:hypothetical protein